MNTITFRQITAERFAEMLSYDNGNLYWLQREPGKIERVWEARVDDNGDVTLNGKPIDHNVKIYVEV